MNEVHVHLLINYVPIVVPVMGLFVMVGGLYFCSEGIKRTAYIIYIFGAIFTVSSFATHNGAGEGSEPVQGVDQSFINTDEETKDVFTILSYVLGGVSISGI